MARILVIDDNTLTRHMLRQALERAGYEVLEASNGKAGVQVQRSTPADMIITDILMPEQGGLETIRVLQRDSPGVKIIAISGGSQIGDYDSLAVAQSLGARQALQKPFTLQDMLHAVHEVLHTHD